MIHRSNSEFPYEQTVENKITEIIKSQKNITFIISSSQNIDRIVSAYRSCLKTGKIFIIDLYTAWILEQLKLISNNVPNMEWDNIRIYADYNHDQVLKNNAFLTGNFRKRAYDHRIKKEEISENPSNYLYLTKMSKFKLIDQYKSDDNPVNVIYSQWFGYLKQRNQDHFGSEQIASYQNDKAVNFIYAHTSGHATVDDLKKFAEAINPKRLVPIHTELKSDYNVLFKNVLILDDNEEINL